MLTVTVSPNEGGDIQVGSYAIQTTASQTYGGCSTVGSTNITAFPSTGYRFDRWGGALSGSANPSGIVVDASKSVTAYFVLSSQEIDLDEAINMIDSNKELIVLDVRSANDFDNGHMLCARNYPWNGTAFSGGIASLTPYKENDILIYDQSGTACDNAADYLVSQGFKSVYYMTDGLSDWIAEGHETYMTAEDGGICTSVAPLAYAGQDKVVNENASVTLNGQGPSGASYLWEQKTGADVTWTSSKTIAQPSFRAPDLNSGDDELLFLLTVSSGALKDSDSVTVNVTWNNQGPTANAGPDKTVKAGSKVALDASKSTDPENSSALTYNWSVSSASGVSAPALSNPSAKNPTFMAPNKDGWVEFRLMVTDSGAKTDDDKVKVTIKYTPSSLTAAANSSSSIALGWNDNSTNETGFKIEKKEGGCSSANPWTYVATAPKNAASYTASGLSAGKTYSFRIKTTGPSGDSGYSNCAGASTGAAGTPKSPSNLTATSATAGQINLTWKDNSTNETGFQIFRKAGSGAWTKIFTSAAGAVSYNDASASGNQSSTIYQYYLKACNGSGCSPKSNTAIVPYAPINLTAAALTTAGKIKLAWTDKSSNETGFQIYRKPGACSGSGTWELVATAGPNVATWTDSGLTPGSEYSYQVRAYRRSASPYAYGYSQWSSCAGAVSP